MLNNDNNNLQNQADVQNLYSLDINSEGTTDELIVYFMGIIIIPSIMVGYLVYHSFGYI